MFAGTAIWPTPPNQTRGVKAQTRKDSLYQTSQILLQGEDLATGESSQDTLASDPSHVAVINITIVSRYRVHKITCEFLHSCMMAST